MDLIRKTWPHVWKIRVTCGCKLPFERKPISCDDRLFFERRFRGHRRVRPDEILTGISSAQNDLRFFQLLFVACKNTTPVKHDAANELKCLVGGTHFYYCIRITLMAHIFFYIRFTLTVNLTWFSRRHMMLSKYYPPLTRIVIRTYRANTGYIC